MSETTDDVLARPISDLHLSVRARKALVRLNAYRLGDVITKTEDDITLQHNIGPTTLSEIRSKLRVFGLALRGDGSEVVKPSPVKPVATTEPTWIKIGDRAVKTESIHEVWRNGGTWLLRQSGMCSTPLTSPEGDALWAYFTDPVRCVDLTPDA